MADGAAAHAPGRPDAAGAPPVRRVRAVGAVRLVPSRYPSVGLFDAVASPADLEAVIELEGWTNDRISAELGLINAVPREEWVTGRPMASVVMAAFCHARPGGGRFNDGARGAWYAAFALETAHAEVVYHRTRELQEVGVLDARVEMREFRADFDAAFHDLRRTAHTFDAELSPTSYTASQRLARHLFDAGANGIVYPSVRHAGGTCLACFRPALVTRVRVGGHFEYRWSGTPAPEIRKLTGIRAER